MQLRDVRAVRRHFQHRSVTVRVSRALDVNQPASVSSTAGGPVRTALGAWALPVPTGETDDCDTRACLVAPVDIDQDSGERFQHTGHP